MNELILGSRVVSRTTGQSGYVAGFYVPLPGAEAHLRLNDDGCRIAGNGQAPEEWLQETSYARARAGSGFVRLIRPQNGPAYWRLADLEAFVDDDDVAIDDEDDPQQYHLFLVSSRAEIPPTRTQDLKASWQQGVGLRLEADGPQPTLAYRAPAALGEPGRGRLPESFPLSSAWP